MSLLPLTLYYLYYYFPTIQFSSQTDPAAQQDITPAWR